MEKVKRKFESRYSGTTQFVSDFSDMERLEVGHWPIFLFEDSGEMEFQAFFEGRELTLSKKKQKVFLQYEIKTSTGGMKDKEIKVGEFNFPLSGKIMKEDIKKYLVKYHPVNA